MIDLQQYIEELQLVPIDELTEHSKRSALENLLKQAAVEYQNNDNKIIVLHEPKRKENYGSPDFKIYTASSIIGYVENKKVTEILDKILKSDQIKKYRELSDNILLTNYIDFVWIKGDLIEHETLCYLSDLENKKFILNKNKEENVKELLKRFFSQAPKGIASPKELALALAIRGKNLKEFLTEELNRQSEIENKGALYDVYDIFKNHVFNELTISEFGDAFAQMLVYGLFLAKLNADNKEVTLENIKKYIPTTFQLIHELVRYLDELNGADYNETKWIVDETLSIMNNLDLSELKKNLTFSKKIKDNENIDTDPYIYFYETFLSAYDRTLRKSKGVYYTPNEVVNYIVRAIDFALKHIFDVDNGLANSEKVTVLDFATGTGTFMLEIFKQILNKFSKDRELKKEQIIKDHLLKNIYGFEYLIAPYTIAHLKLSQFLIENGYKFQAGERLQVFLTNTLEPIDKQYKIDLLPALTQETKNAQAIKDKPILVITGNPPYSGHSTNNGLWIKNLMKTYFTVDGKPLKEQNSKWLQDDYVKFIRFAEYKMQNVEQGIVAIITNHSFLDNPTFRGMRQSLMNTFDLMYFVDLHGNSSKKETTPDGQKDENVFDIKQGVCISILIKKKGLEKSIYHTDFFGLRSNKYNKCLHKTIISQDFKEINPNSPFYLFVPQNQDVRAVYDKFWSVKDIFEVGGTGVVTKRDNLAIHYQKEDALQAAKDILKLEKNEFYQKYNLPEDVRDWRYEWAKQDIIEHGINENLVKKILHRPFDIKSIVYTGKSRGFIGWPVIQVMKHFDKQNIGLITVRQVAEGIFNHALITDKITDFRTTISNKGGAYIFPLYRYNGNGTNGVATNYLFKEDDKKDNFTEGFRNFIKTKYVAKPIDKKKVTEIEKSIKELKNQLKQVEKLILSFEKSNADISIVTIQKQTIDKIKSQIQQKNIELKENSISTNINYEPSPEQILGYIYAILYSKTFRTKYAEFLKMDYPKIPFTNDIAIFEKLSNIGFNLIEKHLLKTEKINPKFANIGIYKGKGDNVVVKTQYIDNKLYINQTQYFDNVPEKVFNFYIGGYKVLEKYLKDRKNRSIYNDFEHIEKIIRTLADTIETMQEIDKLTKEWI